MYSEHLGDGKVALVFENIQEMLDFGRLLDDAKYCCDKAHNRDMANLVSKCVTPQFLVRATQEFRRKQAANGRPLFVCGEMQ